MVRSQVTQKSSPVGGKQLYLPNDIISSPPPQVNLEPRMCKDNSSFPMGKDFFQCSFQLKTPSVMEFAHWLQTNRMGKKVKGGSCFHQQPINIQ